MTHKAIKWIENQLKKLESPDFDFEVWETSTCLMLDTLFGNDNPFSQRLLNLDNTFNSWSLRDATGNESYEERSKKMAAEILQSAMDELEIMGKHEKNRIPHQQMNDLLNTIFDELKGSQVRILKQVLQTEINPEEKMRRISDILREAGNENYLLTSLLLHPYIAELLKHG